MSDDAIGYLLVFLSAASFSFSSVIAKWAYGLGFTPYSYALGASLWAVLILALVARRRPWLPPRGAGRSVLAYCLSGALSGLLFNVTLFYLDISLTTLLVFTFPALVALGAWLWLGQRPSALQAVAVTLTLAGAVLTAGPVRGDVHLLGVGLAVVTAVTHSAYMLVGEGLSRTWDATAATAFARGANALLSAAVAPGAVVALAHTGAAGWGYLLFAGVVAAACPFLFLMHGMARVGASRAAVVSAAELPLALLFGRLVMSDSLTWLQGTGAALITLAVLLIAWPAKGTPAGGREPAEAEV